MKHISLLGEKGQVEFRALEFSDQVRTTTYSEQSTLKGIINSRPRRFI